jgi:hypothetical protein
MAQALSALPTDGKDEPKGLIEAGRTDLLSVRDSTSAVRVTGICRPAKRAAWEGVIGRYSFRAGADRSGVVGWMAYGPVSTARL